MVDDLEIPGFLDRRGKSEAHTMRAHARLAPSAAYRWFKCPGSVPLSDGVEEKSSVFAAEGTAAHELAAHCLKMGFDADRFARHAVDIEADTPAMMFLPHGKDTADGKTRFLVDDEMVDAVQEYLDCVRSIVDDARKHGEVELDVEQRLDMSALHPDIFGTGDTCIYSEALRKAWVVDFKYGKGVVVDVAANPQLMTYGSGTARRYHNRPLDEIELVIVQPRAAHNDGSVRSWTMSALDLFDFEDDLSSAARRVDAAAKDLNEPGVDESAWRDEYLTAGDWCRFCPVFAPCDKARAAATNLALEEFSDGTATAPVSTMTPEQLAEVLAQAEFIGNWVKAVQEHAHAEAMEGRCPPGWKLVAKRALRKWKDPEGARNALLFEHDLDETQVDKEPEFKSPAQIEKVIGKKAFAAIEAAHVVKRSSGVNLAPESDKRPAVKPDGLSEFESCVD